MAHNTSYTLLSCWASSIQERVGFGFPSSISGFYFSFMIINIHKSIEIHRTVLLRSFTSSSVKTYHNVEGITSSMLYYYFCL